MAVDIREGDVFSVGLPQRSFALVYADPPYAGCRAKYARRNNSRQWGRNARADFMRELIARMESLRSPDGVCAVSMASPELKLLHLFPSTHRVMPWVKPHGVVRPNVWPAFAWEPLVVWGRHPGRGEQAGHKTPNDWLLLSPRVKGKGKHETPKPSGFAEWVLDMTLGPRTGHVLELYAGTAPVCHAAEQRGCRATGVDLVDWLTTQCVGCGERHPTLDGACGACGTPRITISGNPCKASPTGKHEGNPADRDLGAYCIYCSEEVA